MNVVREIAKINELELELGASGASWHDEYKDSAYIFVGGLHFDLTEGDVITIFSQYGEVLDINMPRDKQTGKTRGFGFLMYEDQRSTVLAVDNLNGAKVLEKVLRVDHVKNYRGRGKRGENGEWIEAEEESFNAKPEMVADEEEAAASDSEGSSAPDIDPEDPMREYLLEQWREQKKAKATETTTTMKKNTPNEKKKKTKKRKDETSEERRARKERKREKRAKKSAGERAVEALLSSLSR